MSRNWLMPFLIVGGAASLSASSVEPLLIRSPTLSLTQIAFAYGGEIWIVNRNGGDAHRLITGSGRLGDPVFSPDGAMIAYTGNYHGNDDVYVAPAMGGEPRRLTYHPGADAAIGWTKCAVHFAAGGLHGSQSQAIFCHAGGWRISDQTSPADGCDWFVFTRWHALCLWAGLPIGALLETISRRPNHADLDCESCRLKRYGNPAQQFQ